MSSLDHLPSSPSSPRKNPLPRAFLMTLAMALMACEKPQAPVASEASAPNASSALLTDTLVGTTVEQRRLMVDKVMRLTLSPEQGNIFSISNFDVKNDGNTYFLQLETWVVWNIDIPSGVHLTTHELEDGKQKTRTMIDSDADGNVDSAIASISWQDAQPSFQLGDKLIHLRHKKSSEEPVTSETQDAYAKALETTLHVLEEKEQAKQKEQK